MSEALQKWLDNELQDYEQVLKSFKGKQQRMYYIWMAVAVVGMVALGFAVGYEWTYVLRVHFVIGLVIALFIWLCALLSGKASTIKAVRKKFEKALSALSPSDQEAIAQQNFGRTDFLNTSKDSFPARLLVGSDFWIYFRSVCHIYRVSDMTKLSVQEEKTSVNYNIGNTHVRQRVGVGVSVMVDYRDGTVSSDGFSDQLYLASWDQFKSAKELITQNCPKVEYLWEE